MKRRGATFTFWGALIFFATVAVVVMVAVEMYVYVDKKSGGDRKVISIVMLFTILFLSLMCTLADIVRRRKMIDRPVEQILDATEKIAAGDFSVRLAPRHRYGNYDQYDSIMENINTLAAELGKSEVLKTDFISNVSHELKTPLAILRNYAALMKVEGEDKEKRDKYADILIGAAKRLSDLVTNILKLNKLENRELTPELKSVRLDKGLAEAVLQYEETIEKKQLEVECEFDEVTLFTSEGYLDIVWKNLLSNAVKFTEKGGKIAVSLKATEDGAIVKVSDTGCGIPPEIGSRIFEKFYQGDASHSGEGNGLGLALVKKVIEILGGEISVESEKGKGTTFTVILRNGE
ncbi:MAG: HAMP domain-containing histidine kinase [Clostridia bacterium]|nr:HAMP domain-containing histidine kinase [Clostridia bacterium]